MTYKLEQPVSYAVGDVVMYKPRAARHDTQGTVEGIICDAAVHDVGLQYGINGSWWFDRSQIVGLVHRADEASLATALYMANDDADVDDAYEDDEDEG